MLLMLSKNKDRINFLDNAICIKNVKKDFFRLYPKEHLLINKRLILAHQYD